MRYWLRFTSILFMAVAISSIASHIGIRWLGIKSSHGGYRQYGSLAPKALTILHGSSIAWDGLDWSEISGRLRDPIESWITPGSSPVEWEVQHKRSPQVNRAFIVVSPYDLNEYFLCDFRANIVPLGQSIQDLRYCNFDQQLCKRILSQYPQMLVRTLFPTVGRSDGVMVGIRAKIRELQSGVTGTHEIDAPILGSTKSSEVAEKLSEWPSARLQRRLVSMRSSFEGKHWFNGSKKMALARLVKDAEGQGEVLLIVMPVSLSYQKEFISPNVLKEFNETLAELQNLARHTKIIRLDQLSALNNDDMFSDLVHLNMYGQRVATTAFLEHLRNTSIQP